MSECKHGYYCKDGTPCALCHEDELAALRAKLQEAVGIAQKFAEAARDACIAGLAQSAKLRQAEVRIAELEAEVARLREALEELIEVSDLRGDIDEIPHPCDDPKLWTARLISAWDNARAALEAKQ